ncbi:DUF6879 family protein [Streptomyces sp. NPDC057654]|uniref:DUF6879 family protein n=1 Tax=Streptomyces sp. NPDC057654 TaxID=3346196 RepID=UPI00368187A0
MPEFIDDATFGDYFREFEHTAWRLETRRAYASDVGGERYARFLRGQELGLAPSAWTANIEEQVAQGKRIERVRVLDEPPTDGQRFLLASAVNNIAAGEDIRHLWRADADRLGLPAEDFWLFDSRRALLLHFDAADEYLGAELVKDPPLILRYCQLRDAAWHYALRREEFVGQVRSRV